MRTRIENHWFRGTCSRSKIEACVCLQAFKKTMAMSRGNIDEAVLYAKVSKGTKYSLSCFCPRDFNYLYFYFVKLTINLKH